MPSDYINSVNLNSKEGFPFLMTEVTGGQSIPRPIGFGVYHWHEDLQIVWCLEGKLEVRTLSRQYTLSENQALYLNSDVVHRIVGNRESHYVSFLYPKRLVSFDLSSIVSGYVNHLNADAYFMESDSTIEEVKNLYTLYRQKAPYYEYAILISLSKITYALLANHTFTRTVETPAVKRVHLFLEYITEHYREEITLEDLAGCSHVSKSECLRCFHEVLGTTPYRYLMDYRIQKGIELLENSDLSVGQIAIETGFNQVSYLGRKLKEKTGYSPREYRKQLKHG